MKRDKGAIKRNPETINRIYGRLSEMGIDEIFKKCSEPKETNRQIGPLFGRWINKNVLGVPILKKKDFISEKGNAVFNGSDKEKMDYAKEYLNYNRDKGLDFVARFNNKHIIGEAKFLTDFGGHQNAQFSDAISTLEAKDVKAIIIAILDGVLYIKGRNKMYKDITNGYSDYNIMSALVLREYLFSV